VVGFLGGWPLWVLEPRGYRKLTVSTTPISLHRDLVYDTASLKVERADIRLRVDGGEPSDTDGILVPAGSSVDIFGTSSCLAAKLVRAGVTDATVHVHYWHLDRIRARQLLVDLGITRIEELGG
jgi:hypothetical protein